MDYLKDLIREKLEANKSYRRIGEECGINHVSIARYHNGEATPTGKNLALLAKYFHVKMEDLVEPRPKRVIHNECIEVQWEQVPPAPTGISSDTVDLSALSAEQREGWDVLMQLPPARLKKALALLGLILSDD